MKTTTPALLPAQPTASQSDSRFGNSKFPQVLHTPTPWSFPTRREYKHKRPLWEQIYSESGLHIATIAQPHDVGLNHYGPETMAEAQANAALIVRAVNNHNALVNALRDLGQAAMNFRAAATDETEAKLTGAIHRAEDALQGEEDTP